MTSNLGSHIIQESMENLSDKNQEEVLEETRLKLLDLLRKSIRPEFLNRIDDTIVFTPLSRKDIKEIVRLQFNQVIKRLSGTDIKISISENAVEWLAQAGYDPHFGARPVKRILQKNVLNELSRKILASAVDKTKPIEIDEKEGKLVFKN
jgi:ATP-dependent Clp protease ATP-binding subunit ClpB